MFKSRYAYQTKLNISKFILSLGFSFNCIIYSTDDESASQDGAVKLPRIAGKNANKKKTPYGVFEEPGMYVFPVGLKISFC